MAQTHPLEHFFSPRGVVVVGASHNPNKLGYGISRNLVQSHYRGAVHFVNPKGGTLLGKPVHKSLLEVPDPVELAVLLIPAGAVPAALEECGERGIQAAIIASGGFRETGTQGAALEAHCAEIARQAGIRLIGPNCIGMLDTHLPLDTTFLSPPGPPPGDVAFISHSGAICAAVIDWARGQGFGLSRLVSLGNQADLTETDLLAPVAADPFTRVLTLYLEGVSDGRRFIEQAQQVTRTKPIVALKVGRYASGQRAVASHTGALAGQENAYNAAFRRAGVIRAETSEELFDWARALAWCPLPQGRNIAVLTNAGGPGVTASDAIESLGLQMAELSEGTRQALQQLLPPAASLHNPVDMLASSTPEQYAQCLEVLLKDPGVHGVLVIVPPPPMHAAGAVAKMLIPIIHHAEKPVVIALMGERLIQEAIEHFRAARVPEYRFPERAASALAILAQRAEYLQRSYAAPVVSSNEDQEQVRAWLADLPAGSWVPQDITVRILQAYGIPTLPQLVAHSEDAAVEAAESMRLPYEAFALKILSADIPHKSDVGGVRLNLVGEAQIRQAYTEILENVRLHAPAARLEGMLIQPMLLEGQDVIVGAIQDSQFGALAMFGSGGVEVEGLKDVAFGLAPLTDEEAAYMLNSTWAGRKLRGFRNLRPTDGAAARSVLRHLAQLAADVPELAELEINPLRVLEPGQGAFALDTRLRVR